MAQLNIAHFKSMTAREAQQFTLIAREVVAKEVHGLELTEIQPDSVSVWVVPVNEDASMSGADSEVHVLVSGNNWPNQGGKPANAREAKLHFDKMAATIYKTINKQSGRKVYVWVTPFTASGWAS